MRIEIRDDALWAKHFARVAPEFGEAVTKLAAGETIDLEVNGIIGRWQKMADGRDGRPTHGLKPIGAMREIWRTLQERRGETIEVRPVILADDYLRSVEATLTEWNSPEDEEAFRDL